MKLLLRAASSTFLALGAFLCILIASADAAEWRVAKSTGTVRLAGTGPTPVSLRGGEALRGGAQVTTGANGRILLVRGREQILVSPNSAITLPRGPGQSGKTSILQHAGSILLSVEKRNVRHFEVRTPYLVAVVKGTRFSVSATRRGSEVKVSSGRVEVTDLRSGTAALIVAGESVFSAAGVPGLNVRGSYSTKPVGGTRQTRAVPSQVKPVPGVGAQPRILKGKGRVRIIAAIGERSVNYLEVTRGLASGRDDKGVRRAGKTVEWPSGNGKGKGRGKGKGKGLGLAKGPGGLGLGQATVGLGIGNGFGNGPSNGVGNILSGGLGGSNPRNPGNGKGIGKGKGKGNGG